MQDNHDIDIQKLEQQLADLSPCPLSENLIARMEQAMISWESNLPAEEKIVPFEALATPEDSPAAHPDIPQIQNKKTSHFSAWSAAAAVALMGAVGLTFMGSTDDPADAQLGTMASAENPVQQPTPTNITKHFSHQLMNASNEGITYAGNDKPYKVIRIEYVKDVEHTDANGKKTIKKEPVVEHLMVPVKVL